MGLRQLLHQPPLPDCPSWGTSCLIPRHRARIESKHCQWTLQTDLGSNPKAPQMGIICPFHIWTSVCRHRSLEFSHFNTGLAKGNGREEERKIDQLFLKIFSDTTISFENLVKLQTFPSLPSTLMCRHIQFCVQFQDPSPPKPAQFMDL